MQFGFSKSYFLMLFAIPNREVSEWLKELAWKASMWVTASRVRIPFSLHKSVTFDQNVALFLQRTPHNETAVVFNLVFFMIEY